MSKVIVDNANLTAIANAIRTKSGSQGSLYTSQMAAAILNLTAGDGSGNQKVYYTITLPSTFLHQTMTFALDGVTQSGNSITAEKGSIFSYTAPVPESGFTAGTVTVTGGTRLHENRAYSVTSNMTVTLGEAVYGSGGGGDSSDEYDIEDLRDGENLYMSDVIYTIDNEGYSDWSTTIPTGNLNTAIGLNNPVKLEYSVFIPTGNACAYGPEFIIRSQGESELRISVTNNNTPMNSQVYANGTLWYSVVQFTLNDMSGSRIIFYKQYGANSAGGVIKARLRASDKVQLMTADHVVGGLYTS